MPLITVGISHHTAPLEIRERLAFARGDYARLGTELKALPAVEEAVVLSTCNRTEIYAVVNGGEDMVQDWLSTQGGMHSESDSKHFYSLSGQHSVRHLFRVASGLDSLVLGEPQIIGQLKEAWNAAREAESAGKITDRLFQRAFAASKAVRNHTGINDHPVSVAYIATVLAQQIFGNLGSKNVLMIGAGEMIELCGRHFHQQGVGRQLIANRSIERAETLATLFNAEALALADLDTRLAEADIIISCTSSREPVLIADQVRQALQQRRNRPVFMVDLGVPRDIDPEISHLRDVYLYTIDDLQQVADENQGQRQRAADAATVDIEAAVNDFMRWCHGVRAADSLRQLRHSAEQNGQQLAERAVRQIESGGDPAAIIEQLTNTLVHRILHGPSERLRAAAEQEHLEILAAADWLFDSSPPRKQDDETS